MTDIEAQTKKYWLYCCATCLVLIALQVGGIAIDNKISLPLISLSAKNSAAVENFLFIFALTLYFLHEQNNKRNYFLRKQNTMRSLSQEQFMINLIESRVSAQQARVYKTKIPQIISNSTIYRIFTFNTITHKTNGNGLIEPLNISLNRPLKLYFQVNLFMLRHTLHEVKNSKKSLDLLIPRLFVGAASVKPVYDFSFEVGTRILQFSNNA